MLLALLGFEVFMHCSKSAYFLESSKAGSVGFFRLLFLCGRLGAAHSSVLLVSLCSCLCDSIKKKCFHFVFHFSLGIVHCVLIAQMFLVEFFLFIYFLPFLEILFTPAQLLCIIILCLVIFLWSLCFQVHRAPSSVVFVKCFKKNNEFIFPFPPFFWIFSLVGRLSVSVPFQAVFCHWGMCLGR